MDDVETMPKWLFQASANWTETELSAVKEPSADVDGVPFPFHFVFLAKDWDDAKRIVNIIQGHNIQGD